MKEIKLTPLEPIVISGPDAKVLYSEACEQIRKLRDNGDSVTFTTMYTIMVTPMVLDVVNTPYSNKRNRKPKKSGNS